jgi:hypothetical protein
MSNVAVFNPAQLPAFARKGELSAVAKALAGGTAQTGKRISIKGGVFRLIVDGKEVTAIEDRHLDVVVVNAAPKVSRTFYIGEFDENKPAAPDCWSQDGDKPDPTARNKQHANCANCPQNQKGSGKGDARACRFNQRLAVVLANDIEGDVMQLSLAATSIFGKAEGDNRPLQEYARWLTAQGIDPTMLITRLKFDTKAPVPKLFFKPMRWLTDDEFATTQEKGQSEDAIKAITMTVAQTDGVSPGVEAPMPFGGTPPKAAKPAPAPAAAAPEEEEEAPPPPPKARKPRAAAAPAQEEEAPPPEPTVRAAAPKAQASVPKASGLAATLDQWDDE